MAAPTRTNHVCGDICIRLLTAVFHAKRQTHETTASIRCRQSTWHNLASPIPRSDPGHELIVGGLACINRWLGGGGHDWSWLH